MTRARLAIGADTLPSRPTMRICPGRSVTSMRPSDKKASDHGFCSPLATSVSLTLPASVRTIRSRAATGPATKAAASSVPNNSVRNRMD